jgi:3,8-divinyl chlorophyllide a/chlorophyllide a reductase subunit Z
VLVRISAAKRLRDRAESESRRLGEERVSVQRMAQVGNVSAQGVPA